ncbi:hypothetical protein [Nocardia cyriacigeorgica]|uniref:hypothetical protein n=1 Tax=Nocardia cyriacigeorgica TaxID=135487 RepID=UPI00248F7CF3|nr:hypothetical protein [Nocardia cyriacigeorgica]
MGETTPRMRASARDGGGRRGAVGASVSAESPRPDEDDVRVSVQFHDVRLEFVACRTAAAQFVSEWCLRYHADAATVITGYVADLPRLPNERLYLD